MIDLMSVNFVFAADLNVPYSSQAPLGDWRQPWFDACEETALVMVDSYYQGRSLTPEISKNEILKVFDYKNNALGVSLDENTDKILSIIENYFSWIGTKVYNPSITMIKSEIDAGRPVIAPVAGFELGNPYYRSVVPYHVIILKGYDDATAEFITHDPGLNHGANFRYSYQTVIDANHDFVARDIDLMKTGAKVMIFTDSKITNLVDGSLVRGYNQTRVYFIQNQTKRYITSPAVFSGNGWSWSQIRNVNPEVLAKYPEGAVIDSVIFSGYKPTDFEKNLKNKSLIKSKNSAKVYLLENGRKRYIINPQVFVNHGWNWSAVKIVSQEFIDYLPNGREITK